MRGSWTGAMNAPTICSVPGIAALMLIAFLPAPLHASPPGYVDPAACRSCHSEIYDAYLRTPMGRSFYLPSPENTIADWQEDNHYYHEASDRHYEMTRRIGRLFVRRYQLDESRRQVNVLERHVTHIMGSGERALSYLHRSSDGRIIELPVSWYSQENAWAMAPGYDRPKHLGFTRTINHKCMFCHNGYPDVPGSTSRQGWDADVRFPAALPMGIDCQRCHGPGERHVQAASAPQSAAAVRGTIVNPARLSKPRQLDVCMQCHLETTTFRLPDSYRRFGRSFYSYRPGEPLGDYIVHFDHSPGTGHDDKFEIVSAAYRLRQSACFQESQGELTCTTCHNPHSRPTAAERAAHYRELCMGCHEVSAANEHDVSPEGFAKSDCLPCHMPARRTEDVVHVVMTDHRIQRRKPRQDLLAPLREKTDEEQTYRGDVVLYYPKNDLEGPLRDVYLGIAQVKEKANLKRGVSMLQRALDKAKTPHAEPYEVLAKALVESDKKELARRAYLEALERDTASVQAHNNLGNLLADLGRSDEAIEHYHDALALDLDSADIHVNLGLALMGKGDSQGAEDAFRKAIAANPMYASAHLNLGSLLLVQGELSEAVSELEATLKIEPAEAKARNNLGLALMALGRKEDAAEHLRHAARDGDETVRKSATKYLKMIEESEP